MPLSIPELRTKRRQIIKELDENHELFEKLEEYCKNAMTDLGLDILDYDSAFNQLKKFQPEDEEVKEGFMMVFTQFGNLIGLSENIK